MKSKMLIMCDEDERLIRCVDKDAGTVLVVVGAIWYNTTIRTPQYVLL